MITFGRPQGLARLLRGIAELEAVEGTELVVVVVDNDESGSAESVVRDNRHGLRIEYVIEPQRGITYARNRALTEASSLTAEWIVWMDDDEVPRSDWLRHIFETQRATDADVVIGPSEPIFEPGSVDWVAAGGFFEPERFETAANFPFFHTRTSGVLVRAAVVPREQFDARLALTGGEDRVFFTRIHRNGATFVWDDRAVMEEYVPASRARPTWLLKRWFRVGVTRSLSLLVLDDPGLVRRARRVLGGLLMAAKGLVGVALGIRTGRIGVLASTRQVMLGLGASAGALGISYREYKKTHGS